MTAISALMTACVTHFILLFVLTGLIWKLPACLIPLFSAGRLRVFIIGQLREMVRLELPLVEGLRTMLTDARWPGLRRSLSRMVIVLDRGGQLWQALSTSRHLFDPTTVALVRSGEETGNLEGALAAVERYSRARRLFLRRITASVWYTWFVIPVFVVVVLFMSVKVIPVFMEIFRSFGIATPSVLGGPMLGVLEGVGRVCGFAISLLVWPETESAAVHDILQLRWYLWGFGAVCFFILYMATWVFPFLLALDCWRRLAGRSQLFLSPVIRVLGFVPIVGGFVRDVAAAHVARALQIMISSGLAVHRALAVASALPLASPFSGELRVAAWATADGARLGPQLERWGRWPRSFVWLVNTGESSGRLPEAFDCAAELLENKAQRRTGLVLKALFPALVVCMGWLVGIFWVGMLRGYVQILEAIM